MHSINETIIFAAIQQCSETADHYICQGNRRDAEFYLDTADTYANRLIFCRQTDDIATNGKQRAKEAAVQTSSDSDVTERRRIVSPAEQLAANPTSALLTLR